MTEMIEIQCPTETVSTVSYRLTDRELDYIIEYVGAWYPKMHRRHSRFRRMLACRRKGATLRQVGLKFGVGPECVRSIIQRGLYKYMSLLSGAKYQAECELFFVNKPTKRET